MESPMFAFVLAFQTLLGFDNGFMNALYRNLGYIWQRRVSFADGDFEGCVIGTRQLIGNHLRTRRMLRLSDNG
jgi:hypothetical protein